MHRDESSDRRRHVSGPLEIDTTEENDVWIVRVGGELDAASAPTLQEELDRLLGSPAVEALVLDLAALRFIDSRGLQCLVRAATRSRSDRGQLTIRQPSAGQVRQVIAMTRVGSLLPLV